MKTLLLCLCIITQGFTELPTLVIAIPKTQGMDNFQEQWLIKSLELSISQTGYFNILSEDAREIAYQKSGIPSSPICIDDACYLNMLDFLHIDLLVGTFAQKVGDSLEIETKLYARKEKSLLKSSQRIGIANNPQNYLAITRDLITDLIGFVSHEKEASLLVKSESRPNYTVGAVSLTFGAALWVAWQWLDWNKLDGNSSSPDSVKSQEAKLSGIRGFYASLPPDAKYRAMGSAASVASAGVKATFWNPAGLSSLSQSEVHIGRVELPGGIHKEGVAYASPIGKNAYQSHAYVQEGDDLAKELQFISAWATDLSPWSMYLNTVTMGVRLKMYQLKVGDECIGLDCVQGTGLGSGVDLGVKWKLQPEFSVGFLIQDLYSDIYYNNGYTNKKYSENLPPYLTLGVSWVKDGLTFNSDWQKGLYGDQQEHFRFGLEKEMWNVLALRGGLQEMEHMRIWSSGFGLKHRVGKYGLAIDYSYEYGDLGFLNHRQSFSGRVWF